MITELEIFTKDLHSNFIASVEEERLQIAEENDYVAYSQAIRNVATKLALIDPEYNSLLSSLSEDDLRQIFRVTIRTAYFSNGLLECLDIMEKNDDPIVCFKYYYIKFKPWELEKSRDFLLEKWLKVLELEKEGITFSILDKTDLLLDLLGNACFLGDFERFTEYEEKIVHLFNNELQKDLSLRFYTIYYQACFSYLLLEKGDAHKAENYITKATKGLEQVNHPFLSAWTINNQGIFLLSRGNFVDGLEKFKKAYEFRRIIGDLRGMGASLNNIASVQNQMGLYSDARKSFNKSKDLFIKSTGSVFRTVIFANIAYTYLAEGKFEKALCSLQEGLVMEQQSKNITLDLLNLFSCQIEIYLGMDDLINAKSSLEQFGKSIDNFASKSMEAQFHYFLGLIEGKELNFGLSKKELLKTIALSSENLSDFQTLLKAQVQLATILISNFTYTQRSEELNQAVSIVENLIKACKEQDLLPLLCDVLIIRSLLHEIQNNRKKALKDLTEVIDTSKKAGLLGHHSRAKEQYKRIKKSSKKLSKQEKTKGFLLYIQKSIGSILSFSLFRNPKKIDAELHGVLLSSESGIPVYSKYFGDKMKQNPILASGLLSAVSLFANELFSKTSSGSLKSITHEDVTILIEKITEDYTIIFFTEKDTSELRTKLMQMARELDSFSKEKTILLKENLTQNNPLLNNIMEKSISKFFPQLADKGFS